MIIVLEPQCRGIEHAEINAAFIIFLTKAKPGSRIRFYGDSTHISSVQAAMESAGFGYCASELAWKPISVPNYKSSIVCRLLQELYSLIVIATARSRKDRVDPIILLSATSATLLGVKIIQRFINAPMFIVLHGILESIKIKPESFIKRLAWFRNFLVVREKCNIRYLTTASFIKSNLLSELPQLEERISSLDFPYVFAHNPTQVGQECISDIGSSMNRVNITSAGVGSFKKGTDKFFVLAEAVSKKYSETVRFIYAGRLADEKLKCKIPASIQAYTDDSMLSSCQYDSILRNTDYLIFFYPADAYQYGVSGVFLDAIKYEIPVIAISNDFFKYCTGLIGDFGWLCESEKEIELTLCGMLDNPPHQKLATITNNYKIFKQRYTPEYQAACLTKILNHAA